MLRTHTRRMLQPLLVRPAQQAAMMGPRGRVNLVMAATGTSSLIVMLATQPGVLYATASCVSRCR